MDLTKIQTIDDVQSFAKILLMEGTNIHPDEDFENYVNIETGKASYSFIEAQLRNHLMQQSFAVCMSFGKRYLRIDARNLSC